MIKNIIKTLVGYISKYYYYTVNYSHEIQNIKLKKSLWKSIELTSEQEKDIQSVYGRRISYKWHKLYQSFTGNFDKNYFPEILFSTRLEPILCPRNICKVLQDKSLLEILYGSLPGIRLPKTVVVNCSGIFYDSNRNIINKQAAINLIEQWCKNKHFVIKPTGSCGGQGVVLGRPEEYCNRNTIEKLLDKYDRDFIIQERIINSEEFRALYDRSVNTIRVMTYILDDTLYHTPLILRMGKGGNEVDNACAGGIYIGVSEAGYLEKEAYTKMGERFLVHPDSNIRFEDYYLPNINKIVECAFDCHKRTPHTKFVSWDFTLDEDKNPVLIEANMLGHSTWFPQTASGVSIFGNNTKRILELLMKE